MVRRNERHFVAALSLGRKGTVMAFEESLKVRVVLTSQSFHSSLLRELFCFPWVVGYNPPHVITEAFGAFSASRIDTE